MNHRLSRPPHPLSTRALLLRLVGSAVLSLGLIATARAADMSDAYLAISTGDCKGVGAEINRGLARNDPEAFFLAGYLFDATGCVENDPAKAVHFYRRAADLGNTDAADSLGLLYGLGRGVKQDYAEAYRWFRIAKKPDGATLEPVDDSRARQIGHAMTISHVALSKVRYPLQPEHDSVESTLEAIFNPVNGEVSFRNVKADKEIGSNVPKTRPFTDEVSGAYRKAVKDVPQPADVADSTETFVTPWRFSMRRGRYNQKLSTEGMVSIGDTTPIAR
jgi:hypothetical protein